MRDYISEKNNRKGGFIKYIIIIILALVLLRHYNLTIYSIADWFNSLTFSGVIEWLKELFRSVF